MQHNIFFYSWKKYNKGNKIPIYLFIYFLLQIDTLAAEYPSVTNYLYVTYNGQVGTAKLLYAASSRFSKLSTWGNTIFVCLLI